MQSLSGGGFFFILLSVLSSIYSFSSVVATDSKDSCNISIEANSKQKFIVRATGNNVELLYLRLVFLNESHPNEFSFGEDVTRIYDPLQWAWTNSEEGKAILSLPYDYKVLSLSTLSRETREMDLSLVTLPPGCFAKQRDKLQLTLVMNKLVENARAISRDSLVCHRFVEDSLVKGIKIIYQAGLPTIRFKCCIVNKPKDVCTMVALPNTALSLLLRGIWFVSCVVAFFTPLLVKYLPSTNNEIEAALSNYSNSANSSTCELESRPGCSSDDVPFGQQITEVNEDDYINYDTATPLTSFFLNACGLHICLKVCSRFSRFLLFCVIAPAVLIVALAVYSVLLKRDVDLQRQAEIRTDFLQMFFNPDPFLIVRVAAYILSCVILCVPSNISEVVDETLILIGDLQNESSCCCICAAMKHAPSPEITGIRLLFENMSRHLKYLLSGNFWKLTFSVSIFPSRWLLHFFTKCERLPLAELWRVERTSVNHSNGFACCRVIGVLPWLLLLPFWLVAFFFIVFLIVFLMLPIGYFLACISFLPFVLLTQKFGIGFFTWLAFLICFLINILSACFLIELTTFTWNFIFKLFGFTLMGLVVGIDYYIPFIAYAISISYYLQDIGKSLNDKYLKLKALLFAECEKQQNTLDSEADNDVMLLIKNRKTEMPMIPKELFEIVCNKYLPLRKTITSEVYRLLVIIIFLTFAFLSIMAFGKWAKIPSLTEAVVTFFISTLPKLLRSVGKRSGWSTFKEKKQLYSLEVVVSQFVRKQKNLNVL